LSEQKEKRPSWDQVWMNTAKIIAKRSTDERYQVGAVIVSNDNTQILALGYNGNYKGGPNESDSSEPGQSGNLHAEVNALLKMDYNNPKKKTMYVTLSCCRMCSKAIINSGIDKVVYCEVYRDTTGLDILTAAGIEVEKFDNI
jgi:dCMP deaminase